MKIIFIGGVEIGYTVLEGVYTAGYEVSAIYTLPHTSETTTSGFIDFEPLAQANGSPLYRTKNINEEEHIEHIRSLAPDLIIVCGWQRLVCKEILEIPSLGTIGFHSSLLPKYRGRAPVNWAMIMGEKETGITMFYLTPEADAGDIIAQYSFPILLNDDCHSVYLKSAQAGAKLIIEYLPKIASNSVRRIHNPSLSYPAYPKRTPQDGLIDFNRSALDIYNFVRALTRPYPGAFYYNTDRKKVIVWKIEIVFDDNRLQPQDIIFDTLDLKIRLIDFECE
jgi:methionyl-tRNA formyltransferase